MALRETPRLRMPLRSLVALNLMGLLAVGCGDTQTPNFRSQSFNTVDEANSEDALANPSGDVTVIAEGSNPEPLDEDALAEAMEEAGLDPYSRDDQDGTDVSSMGSGDESGSGDQTASSGADGSSSTGSGDTPGIDYGEDSEGTGSVPEVTDGTSDSDGSDNTAGGSSGTDGTDTSDGGSDTGDSGTESGVNYYAHSQYLVQPESKPVDILWVVDSSGSMKEEQEYLSKNFDSFMDSLLKDGASFQTAVTTTDICNEDGSNSAVCPYKNGGDSSTHLRGRFTGDPGKKVLSSEDADVAQRFSWYSSVGTDGSGFEHGLEAAKLAVKRSLSGKNEKLVRDGAFLSVIVVSDEEDDGIGLGMVDAYSEKNLVEEGLTTHKFTHNDLITYLKSVKGVGNFAVSTVTGTRKSDGSMCSSPHSKPKEEGTQYIAAAKATGGSIQSICDTDWSTSLGQIGQDINSQITQVKLDKVPLTSSIVVRVNGITQTDWSYIEASNSIKFGNNSIPAPGAQITVDYKSLEQ